MCLILGVFSNSAYCADNIENINHLTTQAYFLDVFGMVNKLQDRLTLANKILPSDVIGSETIEGYISGTLTYDAKLKGVGVDVTIIYDNFSDEEGWIFDGTVISHAKVVGKGSYEGEITISGVSPGKIIYSDVKSKMGYPTEGTIEVFVEGLCPQLIDLECALKTL